MDENLLYEIIAGQRKASADAPSSSMAYNITATKSMDELLSDIVPVCNEFLSIEDVDLLGNEESLMQDKKPSGSNEECCSFTSSNRESWGRCSSLGSGDETPSLNCTSSSNRDEMTIKVLGTPLRNLEKNTLSFSENDSKKNKTPTGAKKSKREKFEKLEALSQWLRLCILKRVNHKRNCSS